MGAERDEIGTRNNLLDILRGWAIFGVVICHIATLVLDTSYSESVGVNTNFFYALSLGRYGVEVFFFLSGFLLSQIYGNSVSVKSFEISKYWKRRILRIFPLWIMFWLIAIIEFRIFNFGPWISGESKSEVILAGLMSITFTLYLSSKYWGLVPGGWSIQTEVFQYICFPILRYKKWRLPLISILVLLHLAATFIGNRIPESVIVNNFFDSVIRLQVIPSIFFFALGIAIQEVYTKKLTLTLEAIGEILFQNSWFIVLLVTSFIFSGFNNQNHSVVEAFFILQLLLIFSILCAKVPILNRIFTWLGQHSYFYYFMHFQVIMIMTKTGFLNFLLAQSLFSNYYYLTAFLFMLTMIFVAPLAEASMRLIERPILAMGRK